MKTLLSLQPTERDRLTDRMTENVSHIFFRQK